MLANRVRMGAGGGSSKIYGVEIDESNSNPLTSVVYTDAAVGFTPASGNDGNFIWGSWEDIIKNDFAIRPCLLVKGTGNVNYYLDYDNYNKKADGSTSNLTGTDGDVMVEFGTPLWWKFARIGNKLKVQLSNEPFSGAIKPAFEIEDGYNLVHIYQVFLLQILYLIMFKNLNSQTALGRGMSDQWGSDRTGGTTSHTFCYGTANSRSSIKFLGIEDFWGKRRYFAEGCYFDSDRNILIGKKDFNNTGIDYTNYGQASPSSLSGYTSKVQGSNHTGFIPNSTDGGNASAYYCDRAAIYDSRLPVVGGDLSEGDYVGAFFMVVQSATAVGGNGRLSYSKNDKIYIGAFLGDANSKTNQLVSGSSTFHAARFYARGNNP